MRACLKLVAVRFNFQAIHDRMKTLRFRVVGLKRIVARSEISLQKPLKVTDLWKNITAQFIARNYLWLAYELSKQLYELGFSQRNGAKTWANGKL